MVYLLHFDQPFGKQRNHQANPRRVAVQHYIGYTDSALSLEARLEAHRTGTNGHGSLMRELSKAGIGFTLARTWDGDQTFERSLKNKKNARKLCPLCQGS
jgi:hypothetical protein